MKLKMARLPRPGQKDMVYRGTKAAYKIKIGESFEIDDLDAAELMKRWPGIFEQVKRGPKPKEDKMVESYENKAII